MGVGVAVCVGVGLGVTVPGTPEMPRQAENSEVLPAALVAVAVANRPGLTVAKAVGPKAASPNASVMTSNEPMKVSPSPDPEPSHAALTKNSRRNVVLGVLLSVPATVVMPPAKLAVVSTGKF